MAAADEEEEEVEVEVEEEAAADAVESSGCFPRRGRPLVPTQDVVGRESSELQLVQSADTPSPSSY
jgi:hypothetical protein